MKRREKGRIVVLYDCNRESTEEVLLGLLEDTCNKVTSA